MGRRLARGGRGHPRHRRRIDARQRRRRVARRKRSGASCRSSRALGGAGALISIDTMKAAVAEAAIAAGAHIVNDVRGLQGDPDAAARGGAPRRRRDRHAQSRPARLDQAAARATRSRPASPSSSARSPSRGAPALRRTASRSIPASASASRRSRTSSSSRGCRSSPRSAFPILIGTSRKSFIGKVTGPRDAGPAHRHDRHQRRGGARRRGDRARPRRRRACRGDAHGGGDPRRRRRDARLDRRRPRPRRQYRRQPRSSSPRRSTGWRAHPGDRGRGGVRALRDAALGQDGPAALPERRRADRDDAVAARRCSTPCSTSSGSSAASASERWGPRTVDIDILLFGDEAIDEPGLHVPHPHLHERAFALAPLVDVMPDARAFRPPRRRLAGATPTAPA